jgi:hypothetical protein
VGSQTTARRKAGGGVVATKKDPATCDDRALKAIQNHVGAQHSALAFQSQINFLKRRFGLAPAHAAATAELAFPDRRAA